MPHTTGCRKMSSATGMSLADRSLLEEVEHAHGASDRAAHAQHGNEQVALARESKVVRIAEGDRQHRGPSEQAGGENPQRAARALAYQLVEAHERPADDRQAERQMCYSNRVHVIAFSYVPGSGPALAESFWPNSQLAVLMCAQLRRRVAALSPSKST